MHDQIRSFFRAGDIGHDNLLRVRQMLIDDLEDEMRDNGCVPVLDLHPQFTRSYDKEKDKFYFELTIYGVESDSPWEIAGIMAGKEIPFNTPKSKYQES